MTYEEALHFKQAFKTGKITFDGLEFNILVVPGHQDDFKKYCDNYRTSQVSDQLAREYCTNDKFQLMALHVDVASIQYKYIG